MFGLTLGKRCVNLHIIGVVVGLCVVVGLLVVVVVVGFVVGAKLTIGRVDLNRVVLNGLNLTVDGGLVLGVVTANVFVFLVVIGGKEGFAKGLIFELTFTTSTPEGLVSFDFSSVVETVFFDFSVLLLTVSACFVIFGTVVGAVVAGNVVAGSVQPKGFTLINSPVVVGIILAFVETLAAIEVVDTIILGDDVNSVIVGI
jgi:hypothetical protein